MSAIEVVKQVYRAFADDDVPALLELLDPEVEWIEAEGYLYGGTYHGRDAVRDGVLARDRLDWEAFAASPERILGDGDEVVTLGWYSGTFVATGKPLRARFSHWYVVRDGRVVRFEQVVDSAMVAETTAP